MKETFEEIRLSPQETPPPLPPHVGVGLFIDRADGLLKRVTPGGTVVALEYAGEVASIQSQLDGKASVSHGHPVSDISGFTTAASAAAPVQSVAGRTGDVQLEAEDIVDLASRTVTAISGALGVEASGSVGSVSLQLSSAAQASLALADTALQSLPSHGHASTEISGLGSAATMASAAFATAAQGAKADSALQSLPTHSHTAADITSGLAAVATSNSYNDLDNKPTIPAAQVNSDWNAGSGISQILNKPTTGATGLAVLASADQATAQTAIGVRTANNGGAVGYMANANNGFAGGVESSADSGGAVGYMAFANNGFAGGYNAIANGNHRVQLGTGTNSTDETIQFRNAGSVSTTKWGYLANATTTGGALMTTANAAAARTTLELGTAATEAAASFALASHTHTPSQVGLTTGATGLAVLATTSGAAACAVIGALPTSGGTVTGDVEIQGDLALTAGGDLIVDVLEANELKAEGVQVHDSAIAAIASNALALPVTGNVLRITGTGPINSFAGGELGAVYYLINETGGSLTLTHSASLFCRGATNRVLANTEAATLIVRSPGQVSID